MKQKSVQLKIGWESLLPSLPKGLWKCAKSVPSCANRQPARLSWESFRSLDAELPDLFGVYDRDDSFFFSHAFDYENESLNLPFNEVLTDNKMQTCVCWRALRFQGQKKKVHFLTVSDGWKAAQVRGERWSGRNLCYGNHCHGNCRDPRTSCRSRVCLKRRHEFLFLYWACVMTGVGSTSQLDAAWRAPPSFM